MIDPVALLRTLHGHAGLLAAVALLHPALTLKGPARSKGTRWSLGLSTGLATATVIGGWLLYPGYRDGVKPRLLHEAFPLAMAFETKEHLATFALVLAWTGCGLALGTGDRDAHRPARICYGAASALAFTVGILGSVVASARP